MMAIVAPILMTMAGTFVAGTTWTLAIIATIVQAGMFLYTQSQFNADSSSPSYSFGPIQNTKTQKLPVPIVYGEMLVAGNIFYEKFKDDKCEEVDRMFGLSVGPIQSISSVKIGDNLITDCEGCTLTTHLNTNSGTTDPLDPVSGAKPYPTDNPVNGIAFISTHLKAGDDVSGSDVVTSIVKGRQVWTPNGTVWSDNPAWCIYDLLTNTTYGCGIPTSRIDLASFTTAAGYYDAVMASGKKRFTLNYVIDTQKKAVDILADMLSVCFSYIISREKIQLIADKPVQTYSKSIGVGDIIDGSFEWTQKSENDRYNRIVIEWCDPDNSYEQVVSIFEDETDQAARGVIEQSVCLLGCTNVDQANRSGARMLDSSMSIKEFCSFKISLKNASVECGDVIALTHDITGWTNKWMRVVAVTDVDNVDDQIQVTCAEYIAEVYDDIPLNVPAHIDTGIHGVYIPDNVTGLTITDSVDTTLSLFATISWTAQTSINGYELSYRFNNTGNWIGIGSLSQGVSEYRLNCDGHNNDTLTVRVVTVSTLGRKSSGVTASKTLNAQPPANVTGLQAVQDGNSLDLFWDANNESNFRFYEIRKGNIWDISQLIARTTDNYYAIPCSVAGTYSYLVKAVDANGVYSVNAANTIISISGSQLLPTNVYVDYDAITLFNEGTADGIRLISNPSTWATISETWNEVTRTWDEFGAEYIVTLNADATDGTYISAVKDLAKVISADLAFTISYYMTLGDTVTLEIRTSTDNITWTGWQPADNRLQKFRYIQWRFVMHAADVTNQPYITQFKLRIDMPDVQKTGRATIPVGGGQISFGYTFAIKPTIVLTAEGADKQAFYNATDLDYSSVVATVKDTDGTDTGGNINWIALGY